MIRYCSDWKPRRGAEHVAELHVLARRQRGQHAPLLEQLALDLLDAREALLGRAEIVGGQAREHLLELVDDQPHPQLGGLVLDDEQQLVVVLGLAQRMLGVEQLVQVEIARVGQAAAEIAGDARFDVAAVLVGTHPSASSSSRR